MPFNPTSNYYKFRFEIKGFFRSVPFPSFLPSCLAVTFCPVCGVDVKRFFALSPKQRGRPRFVRVRTPRSVRSGEEEELNDNPSLLLPLLFPVGRAMLRRSCQLRGHT